ncbi:hypothetical protein FM103_08790 [Corynebacterium xerosis]|nr:hypothetical protein FM103_08790 [Corynebacterium xerosis]
MGAVNTHDGAPRARWAATVPPAPQSDRVRAAVKAVPRGVSGRPLLTPPGRCPGAIRGW